MKHLIPFAVADIAILITLAIFGQWVAFTVAAVSFNLIITYFFLTYRPDGKWNLDRDEWDKIRSTVNALAVRSGFGR